jgi:hypothetical protein
MGFQRIWSFRITEWGEGVELGTRKLEVWFFVPIQYEYPECCCVNDACYRSLKMYIPYFPIDNARVIYTKMFSKRKKMMVRVIHKVHVMQLKCKKFQIIYIPMCTII